MCVSCVCTRVSQQGPHIWRALLDAASTMLLVLRKLLQFNSLSQTVQEELSVFSGGTLHHVGQLLAHTLMYHATLVVSPKGRHIQRLLLSATCLADILTGVCWCVGVLWAGGGCGVRRLQILLVVSRRAASYRLACTMVSVTRPKEPGCPV